MGKKETRETPEERQNREMVESIATNIAKLSREVSSLLSGRVKTKTIMILLSHSTGFSQAVVKQVIDAIINLETDYLSK